jgi:hypothetical protein
MHCHRFHPDHVLKAIGTEPFAAYCQARGIPFSRRSDTGPTPADFRIWAEALTSLAPDAQVRVELELAQVEEMATPDAVAHLIEAAAGSGLPPDGVPAGAGVALWFLVHRPELFRQVHLHQDVRGIETWRTAQAPPGLVVSDLTQRVPALVDALRAFFRAYEGVGRFCAVEAYRMGGCDCFTALLADRLHLVEAFTEAGALTAQRVLPAVQVTFAYDPCEGVILLQSRIRSRDRLLALIRGFGHAVLGVELGEDCLAPAFNLEPLKRDFRPFPDAPDMESVRIKALHLRYPERSGRRVVKLETQAGDGPTAVPDLLHAHLNVNGVLEQLDVCYAELQVRLRVEGGRKSYVIRLSPDRCNLDRTKLGERLRACLRRWGLCYAY